MPSQTSKSLSNHQSSFSFDMMTTTTGAARTRMKSFTPLFVKKRYLLFMTVERDGGFLLAHYTRAFHYEIFPHPPQKHLIVNLYDGGDHDDQPFTVTIQCCKISLYYIFSPCYEEIKRNKNSKGFHNVKKQSFLPSSALESLKSSE